MVFPLADWILSHPGMPHDLSISGTNGEIHCLERILRHPKVATGEEVVRILARFHGVAPERVQLTYGATGGNTSVLVYLAHELGRKKGRAPRVRVDLPEYPPLLETARIVGYREANGKRPDVMVLSDPHNPTGRAKSISRLSALREEADALLIDETFREFTEAPSLSHRDWQNVWLTHSFTKAWGASIHVGYVIVPEAHARRFADYFSTLFAGVSPYAVGSTKALLTHRREILEESRGIFRRNLAALNRVLPEVGKLDASVWFDRGTRGLPGDQLQRKAVSKGVLVCSGSYFGDPGGVRICLTRRSFPEDLKAYLQVRKRFLRAGTR